MLMYLYEYLCLPVFMCVSEFAYINESDAVCAKAVGKLDQFSPIQYMRTCIQQIVSYMYAHVNVYKLTLCPCIHVISRQANRRNQIRVIKGLHPTMIQANPSILERN